MEGWNNMDRRRPRRRTPAQAGEDAGGPYRRFVLPAMFAFMAFIGAAAADRIPHAQVDDRVVMADQPPPLLSHYRFFRDAGAREPNPGVTPYDLNTALYSDGALKLRYVYVPRGAQARYNAEGVFDFPVGTVLIKTFAFAADMRRPTENVRFLETRLLIRRADGWVAYPYVWNEAQTEARYAPVGADVPVSFTDEQGQSMALDWAVPNINQCKGCHDVAGEIQPIGPSARNLNRDYDFRFAEIPEGAPPTNQLRYWQLNRRLDGPPASEAPRVPNAYDPATGTVEARARAYLDVNCAHCHNPQGPAHTSGLDLRWSQRDAALWGLNKRPVAAGRGSAGMDFAIAPGDPDHSFLLYRMESLDPGVMMPELGRQTVDARAIALMREWIAGMESDGRTRQQ
jgi:uncharacterized repeat protein (TIGR03806 family)